MFTTRPELRGSFGMVSSTHWLASSAGMAMLDWIVRFPNSWPITSWALTFRHSTTWRFRTSITTMLVSQMKFVGRLASTAGGL